ncbi:hypothetical protein ACFQKF_01975 [Halalkalicoccus sp. GCM10025322]|uniref:hypothetical protein n=1 Tax=Halalkalicoccus TaxID=332246 RepID=UPI002F961CD0
MSQNPIGTVADEQRLVELGKESDGSFSVPITGPLREAVDLGSEVDWRALEGGDVPRLLVGRIDPEDRSDARYPRTPTGREEGDGSDLFLEVPTPLVGEAGLGLDPEAYDADDPLLFAPTTAGEVATAPGDRTPAALMEDAVVLEPVRFADGTPYRREPVPETSEDSDPVAEAHLEERGEESTPRPETVSAPIDAAVIEGVAGGTDVGRDALVDALETIARDDLIDLEDALLEYGPFTVDERIVGIVDPDWWEAEIAPALDADEATIEAAKRAHDRQAETLLRDVGPEDYRHADESYDAIVAARPGTPETE